MSRHKKYRFKTNIIYIYIISSIEPAESPNAKTAIKTTTYMPRKIAEIIIPAFAMPDFMPTLFALLLAMQPRISETIAQGIAR